MIAQKTGQKKIVFGLWKPLKIIQGHYSANVEVPPGSAGAIGKMPLMLIFNLR
ncbi:hypothetical protein DCCM_0960 [Desulfocucumis palustris]|uniref:Uncharacterized protein n=1 Tax=Desulfocucumis palustris TaxID=1898651 RepID=A0A2L2X9Y8_9FIRM|nr:hypothetical protein DCCM_0960 [Desulfocucumis palustris]